MFSLPLFGIFSTFLFFLLKIISKFPWCGRVKLKNTPDLINPIQLIIILLKGFCAFFLLFYHNTQFRCDDTWLPAISRAILINCVIPRMPFNPKISFFFFFRFHGILLYAFIYRRCWKICIAVWYRTYIVEKITFKCELHNYKVKTNNDCIISVLICEDRAVDKQNAEQMQQKWTKKKTRCGKILGFWSNIIQFFHFSIH